MDSNFNSKNTITVNTVNCESCWLNNFSAFKNCPSQIRNDILENTQSRIYNKGEYLMKNGEAVSGVFCIQEGIVKVTKNGNRNKEYILWIAGKGDIVGLNSFIDDEPFSFSASAIDHVTACFIPAFDLKILLQKEPVIFVQLMKSLCEKLNFIEQRITSLSGKKIKEQCAEMLISIASQSNSENDKRLYINYSINDLASLIGTTKNYLYKILLEFNNKKVLSIHNRKMYISDMGALSSIAIGSNKIN